MNTPVFVDAEGLNQDYPAIDLEGVIENHQRNPQTASLIKVVPSFRGQTLNYDGMSFPSEGDFCDAYDGAADDAIALLNVAEERIPEANFEDVLVFGASRGGNTALLMGIRDRRVNTIIAMAPPVNFYWQPLLESYGDQFVCQFLDGKSVEEARERMVLSSPLLFEMADGVESVFLFHGTRDTIVPLWNSFEMAARLEADGVDVTTFYYPRNIHGSFVRMPQHPTDRASAVIRFFENVGYL
jgi:dipeptidyl aminopeptidase/acylaminoacyl peptidase